MDLTPQAPPSARQFNSILVTGGAGFIGSHVIRRLLRTQPATHVVNLDALTYAGNLSNLRDVEGNPRYTFVKGDIRDASALEALFTTHRFDAVLHLAAESHVDRSITNPLAFLETNILGTATLLNVAKHAWTERQCMETSLFYHVSTDEVYGSLGTKACSRKARLTIRVLRTAPPRPQATTWFGPTTTPTACPLSSRTAPTTTAPISSRKSSFR